MDARIRARLIMKEKLSKKKLREFGILLGICFPLLIGWFFPAITGHVFKEWSLWVGIPLLILGLTWPQSLLYPYKIWMKFGSVLGWINSHLILGLVFIIVLLPIAFIMRATGYDPLRKQRKNKITYREKKQHHLIDLTRIF